MAAGYFPYHPPTAEYIMAIGEMMQILPVFKSDLKTFFFRKKF